MEKGCSSLVRTVCNLVESNSWTLVEHHGHEKPRFHIKKAATINDTGSHFLMRDDASVLITPDLLFKMPDMLGGMVCPMNNEEKI
jgi:hypothetical protein